MPSRLISGGSIVLGSALVTAAPFAFGAWVRPAAGASGVDTILSIWNNATPSGWALENANGKASLRSQTTAGTAVSATVATAFTAEVWTPVLGLVRSNTDRQVYAGSLANTATNVTSNAPSGVNRTGIGARANGTPDYKFGGELGWIAFWNVADHTDDEIAAFLACVPPILIRPGSLIAAVPLGLGSDEPDWWAARSWPVSGTSISEETPPVGDFQPLEDFLDDAGSSATRIEAAISIGDVEYVASAPLPAVKGRMMAVILNLDAANEVASIEIDEGGAVSTAIEGTWNDQDAAALAQLGTGMSNGSGSNSGDVIFRCAAFEMYSAPLTGAPREAAWERLADQLAPVVQDGAVEIPTSGQTTVAIADLIKDPSGTGWSIAAATATGWVSAAISGQSLRLTPLTTGAEPAVVEVTITNGAFRSRTATLRLSVTKQAGSVVDPNNAAYDYEWPLPWMPASAAEVDVITVPTTGLQLADGAGDPAKMALLVFPAGIMTGGLRMPNSRYRGIVGIGFEAEWQGSGQAQTPAGTLVPFGHWAQISFSPTEEFPANPFIYLANGLWRAKTAAASGDWLQTGTNRNPATTPTNQSAWPDIYVQKLHIPNGHYFFSDARFASGSAQNLNPHADFIQITGNRGFRRCRLANCDIRWGGQHTFLYSGPSNTGLPHPEASFDERNCIHRPMPNNTAVYPSKNRYPRYFAVNSDPGNNYPLGAFVPTVLSGVFAEKIDDPDFQAGREYFAPFALNETAGVVRWPTTQFDGVLPISGTVSFNAPPSARLNTAHVGHKWRVTSFADLAEIF